jgi:hypothetical protein
VKSINFKIVAASLTVTTLIVALVVVGASIASGGSAAAAPTAQSATAQAAATPGTSAPQPQPDVYYNLYLQKLATDLGVSQGKLTQSMTQAAKDTIAQAVKDGKLTQAQADSLNQRIDQMAQNGFYGFEGIGHGPGFGGHDFGGPGGPISSTTMSKVEAAVAAKLGLTSAQLTADFQNGQTLADLAKSQNVALADIKTIIINTVKPDLDAAVKAGTLTQAQEDSIIQRIQNDSFTHPGLGIDGPGRGHGGPGFGGPGGPGGPDNDNDYGNTNNTNPAPAATPSSGSTN